ncbi:MAG: DUF983 domain-containing protein [Bacteroidota bacterium]
MLKKGSKIYSVFRNKCPRCHDGDFYINPNPFNIKENLKIYEKCSNCGLKYMIEPSFFYGAMYVSYALTVSLSIAIFIICYLLGLDLMKIFIVITISLILLTPFTLRFSRLIYINFFIHYKSKE